jgi:hypothetical protein
MLLSDCLNDSMILYIRENPFTPAGLKDGSEGASSFLRVNELCFMPYPCWISSFVINAIRHPAPPPRSVLAREPICLSAFLLSVLSLNLLSYFTVAFLQNIRI